MIIVRRLFIFGREQETLQSRFFSLLQYKMAVVLS